MAKSTKTKVIPNTPITPGRVARSMATGSGSAAGKSAGAKLKGLNKKNPAKT